MSETKKSNTPTQRVFLWTVPRSLSTILLKCLSYAQNIQLQIINEPYVSVYYYGPEKKCSNNSVEDKFENVFSEAGRAVTCNAYDDQLSTYQWVKDLLEAEYPGKDLVFCKDHAYCFNARYDMLPTGYKHTFIIRHPQKTFPSLKKITESLCSVDFAQMERKDFPEPMHSGYQRLFELMEHLEARGEPRPIIIDADDLQSHPESIVKQYCEAIGIPFSKDLLHWQPGPDVNDTWITSKRAKSNNNLSDGGFYSAAFKTSTFQPPGRMLDRSEVPQELLPVIDDSLPYYEKMYRLRLKP